MENCLTVLEDRRPKSRCQQGVSMGGSSRATSSCLLPVILCESFSKNSLTEFRVHPNSVWFYLNLYLDDICKDPISPKNHILRI